LIVSDFWQLCLDTFYALGAVSADSLKAQNNLPHVSHDLSYESPFQNVGGCSVATPSPNGALVDSTANVLSHETFEIITDPDPPATFADLFNGNFGWPALNSLVEFGNEIGDICEDPFFGYNPVTLNGKSYEIQPEYSNKFHTCAFVP
jgi:hypothetical protein